MSSPALADVMMDGNYWRGRGQATRALAEAMRDPVAKSMMLHLAEFDFRYNEREALGVDDAERLARSVPGIVGKRSAGPQKPPRPRKRRR